MGTETKPETGEKVCIHCQKSFPISSYWGHRPTCPDCCNKLWYAPKPVADPTQSANWPLIVRMMHCGLVAFTHSAVKSSPNWPLMQLMLKRRLIQYPPEIHELNDDEEPNCD